MALCVMQSSWVRHLHIGNPSRPRIGICHHVTSTHIAHEHQGAETLMRHEHNSIVGMKILRENLSCARTTVACSLVKHHNLVNRRTSLNNARRCGCCNEYDFSFWIELFNSNAERQREHHIAEECCLYDDPLHVRHLRCCQDHNSGLRRICSSSTAT